MFKSQDPKVRFLQRFIHTKCKECAMITFLPIELKSIKVLKKKRMAISNHQSTLTVSNRSIFSIRVRNFVKVYQYNKQKELYYFIVKKQKLLFYGIGFQLCRIKWFQSIK